MVHTHKTLLSTFSPFLRSTLASLEAAQSSTSVVLSIPEVSASALEHVVQILCKPWGQEDLTLSLDQITVFEVLGIPVGFSVSKEVNTITKGSNQHPDSEDSKEVNQLEAAVAHKGIGVHEKTTLGVSALDPDFTDYISNESP